MPKGCNNQQEAFESGLALICTIRLAETTWLGSLETCLKLCPIPAVDFLPLHWGPSNPRSLGAEDVRKVDAAIV